MSHYESQTKKLKEIGYLKTASINPQLYPDDLFWEYSMPSYDKNETPTLVQGKTMHSNRFVIDCDVLLFNKLNVRQKRVWLVENAALNSVCSMEFLPFVAHDANLRFLKQLFVSDTFISYFTNISSGTSNSQQRITPKDFFEQTIILPSMEEQTAIAEALSDADNLIASLEKLIAKKKAIKQGAMQELLTGKKRLPGFSGEWIALPLAQIFHIRKERVIPQNTEQTKCIELEHIESGTGRLLGTTDSQNQRSLKAVFQAGDVLYGKLRPYLKKYHYPKFDGVCSTEIWVIAAFTDIAINQFIYYMLQMDWFTIAANSTTGTKMPRADWSLLKDLEASVPSDLAEQNAIALTLSDMDAEIGQLEKKLAKYRLIKQGMMQELLTGRIRLVETDKKAESAPKGHNQYYDDAIAISAIVNAFYDDRFILGRVKVQKLLYLLRRKQDADVSAFKKKAAGPYNEEARYKGGESIAIKSGYITVERNNKGSKFSKGSSIDAALKYVGNMQAEIDWLLEKFRFYNINKDTKNLEVLATVDMAVCELEKNGKAVNLDAVKDVIRSNKEWAPKLTKPYFTDAAINQAILESKELFS